MTVTLPRRLRDWLLDTFTYESGSQAAAAMADASRWGWLPALSGVSVGADLARSEHVEATARSAGMSA